MHYPSDVFSCCMCTRIEGMKERKWQDKYKWNVIITCFESYSSSSVPLHGLLMYAPTCDSYCVHFKLSTFIAVEQRGVSLGTEAAACSRGPVPGSPYPIQLGFVIGSPGLKDTVHHLTRLNACKMSNQRCVWSLRPRQASFLQTFTDGPRGLLRWSQDQISVSPHMRFLDQDLFMLLAQMCCPPYIKHVEYSIQVEMLLTQI